MLEFDDQREDVFFDYTGPEKSEKIGNESWNGRIYSAKVIAILENEEYPPPESDPNGLFPHLTRDDFEVWREKVIKKIKELIKEEV